MNDSEGTAGEWQAAGLSLLRSDLPTPVREQLARLLSA
jgi:hypothetical protein